jgi:hypothetical protein
MSFQKICLTTFTVINLIMGAAFAQTNDSWQKWKDLRWSGLQQFSKGEYEAARVSFEQALKEAQRIQPRSQNEAISTYDIAQVFGAEGQNKKLEDYCLRALQQSNNLSDGALTTLILHSLVTLRRAEGKRDEVAKLRAELDKIADASVDSRTIGVASMAQDGTITLELRADDGAGLSGHGLGTYAPASPEYKETLMHLGPLRPGRTKLVAPWK